MAEGITSLAERWRPDILVHEDMELGSWIVAERLGIPQVTIQATAWRPNRRRLISEPLNDLRERHGLPRDEELTRPRRPGLLHHPAGIAAASGTCHSPR